MRVLVAYETSAVVRDAFRKLGHDAWSCDILPTSGDPRWHMQCDVRQVLGQQWDLLVAHPECTYLCSSGLHWNKRVPGRAAKTEAGLHFVSLLIRRKAIENPVGCIGTRIRKASQYIQPHEFGHDASKRTGLWLDNLPHLKPTLHVAPRLVNGKKRWANQTDSGQNKLGPSPERWSLRSQTYDGIADAMAQQWGTA